MATAYQPSPSELSQLVALLVQRYSEHRGKDISRVRLARKTLRRMAGRPQLRDGLVDKWITQMDAAQGWLVFVEAEEFLLIKSETAKTWRDNELPRTKKQHSKLGYKCSFGWH